MGPERGNLGVGYAARACEGTRLEFRDATILLFNLTQERLNEKPVMRRHFGQEPLDIGIGKRQARAHGD